MGPWLLVLRYFKLPLELCLPFTKLVYLGNSKWRCYDFSTSQELNPSHFGLRPMSEHQRSVQENPALNLNLMYIQTANTTHIFIKCLHESITFEPSSATIYCLKYAKIQTLSNLYFPVCRQNGIHTFPYLENMYTILSFCLYTGKYGTGKVHISAYFTQW